MVVPVEKATGIQPCKFYGGSLPRPRIYTNPQFNDERVDPPVPVNDPLLSWAKEAHWSMGGLSFKRLRLQGRIEGNINKLRIQREKFDKNSSPNTKPGKTQKRVGSESPPATPFVVKRRRFLDLNDEGGETENEVEKRGKRFSGLVKKETVRKLGDDFDRVADQNEIVKVGGVETRSGKVNGVGEVGKEVKGEKKGKEQQSKIRSSPRLAKLR